MSEIERDDDRAAHQHGPRCGCLGRRGIFASIGALGGLGLLNACAPAANQAAPAAPSIIQPLTKAQRDAMSPDDIINTMKLGNERFRTGASIDRDWQAKQRASAGGQSPMAVLLSCIDSRTPAEILFDLGLGDIFNNRLAGNVVDVSALGGMEFACKLVGAKVVLVLGHTACGAIAGAIAGAKLGNLTALLGKISPAVAATRFTGDRTASNVAFVDAVARTHVGLTMATIRRSSPVLAGLERERKIKIAGAMYNLETGGVEFLS